MIRRALLVFVLAIFSTVAATAGSLSVNPVRVQLSSRQPNAVLQVTNLVDDSTTLQLHVVAWSAGAKEDVYADTNEVIVNPPVVTLAGKAKQVIRVGMRMKQFGAAEKQYRLIIEEVPKPKAGVVATVLRLSIPVFTVPAQPVAPILQWTVSFKDDHTLAFHVRNDGTAHAQLTRLDIQLGDASVSKVINVYVLPQSQREILVTDEAIRKIGPIQVSVTTDSGKAHEELTPTSE